MPIKKTDLLETIDKYLHHPRSHLTTQDILILRHFYHFIATKVTNAELNSENPDLLCELIIEAFQKSYLPHIPENQLPSNKNAGGTLTRLPNLEDILFDDQAYSVTYSIFTIIGTALKDSFVSLFPTRVLSGMKTVVDLAYQQFMQRVYTHGFYELLLQNTQGLRLRVGKVFLSARIQQEDPSVILRLSDTPVPTFTSGNYLLYKIKDPLETGRVHLQISARGSFSNCYTLLRGATDNWQDYEVIS